MMELYLEGRVDVWFQSLKMVRGSVSRGELSEALIRRFGDKSGKDEIEESNKLFQTDSVLEYQNKFEDLRALLLYKDPRLTESYFVSSFISETHDVAANAD